MAAYQVILDLEPDDRESLWSLSRIFVESEHYSHAVRLLERLRDLEPNNREVHHLLALALVGLGDFGEARLCLTRALERIAEPVPTLLLLNSILRKEGKVEEGIEQIKTALEIETQNYEAYISMGTAMIDLGRPSEAIPHFTKAIEVAFDRGGAYFNLARLGYYNTESHEHISTMIMLCNNKSIDPIDRQRCCFAAGETFDRLGLWDRAFHFFREGNSIGTSGWDSKGYEKIARKLMSVLDGRLIERLGASVDPERGRNLIFLVGMPRSGSTLLEQILANHPFGVIAGGEGSSFEKLVNSIPSRLGARNNDLKHLEVLNPSLVERLALDYLSSVPQLQPNPSAFYVDKTLNNFRFLGLIRVLFPGARIVHCRRHPIDTCLSCYFQNFAYVDFSKNFENLIHYYYIYNDFMLHWKRVMRMEILDVRYENLVRSPELTVRGILAYCGLPWDPRCLEQPRGSRVVETASHWQVRSPIYTSSIGRWKNYERHIGSLIDAFGSSEYY